MATSAPQQDYPTPSEIKQAREHYKKTVAEACRLAHLKSPNSWRNAEAGKFHMNRAHLDLFIIKCELAKGKASVVSGHPALLFSPTSWPMIQIVESLGFCMESKT